MSGHGTDDLDKFVDRMGVRQISLPCDHGTRGDLWEEFPLNEQVRPPVSCRTGDRYRVSQPVKGHDSGICSEIAGECDLELIEVFSEPVLRSHSGLRCAPGGSAVSRGDPAL